MSRHFGSASDLIREMLGDPDADILRSADADGFEVRTGYYGGLSCAKASAMGRIFIPYEAAVSPKALQNYLGAIEYIGERPVVLPTPAQKSCDYCKTAFSQSERECHSCGAPR